MTKIEAPWTDEQVSALNNYQREGRFHPFTCPNRSDYAHNEVAVSRGDHDIGLLIAEPDGWHCPACEYRQKWAHAFMAQPV